MAPTRAPVPGRRGNILIFTAEHPQAEMRCPSGHLVVVFVHGKTPRQLPYGDNHTVDAGPLCDGRWPCAILICKPRAFKTLKYMTPAEVDEWLDKVCYEDPGCDEDPAPRQLPEGSI